MNLRLLCIALWSLTLWTSFRSSVQAQAVRAYPAHASNDPGYADPLRRPELLVEDINALRRDWKTLNRAGKAFPYRLKLSVAIVAMAVGFGSVAGFVVVAIVGAFDPTGGGHPPDWFGRGIVPVALVGSAIGCAGLGLLIHTFLSNTNREQLKALTDEEHRLKLALREAKRARKMYLRSGASAVPVPRSGRHVGITAQLNLTLHF